MSKCIQLFRIPPDSFSEPYSYPGCCQVDSDGFRHRFTRLNMQRQRILLIAMPNQQRLRPALQTIRLPIIDFYEMAPGWSTR